MAHGLKRKREKDTTSRKARKVTPLESDLGDHDSVVLEKEDREDEPSEGDFDDFGQDEWGGISASEKEEGIVNSTDEHAGTKPKKPPTGEELRAIKDATDLFRSSSFKLQIDALLPNVRPKSSRIPPLDRFLLSLHTFLLEIPPVPPRHPLEAARGLLKKGIAVPYVLPLPTEDTNWKVAFEKPREITLVGSWANKVSVKSKDGRKFGVDLAVEMPESLFQEKDYLNSRFFHKRAFYLATIADAIKGSQTGLNVDVYYESWSNDPRLTTLVLSPRKDESATDFTKLNAQVCIIPVLPSSSIIPLNRLSPSHSNIRITPANAATVDSDARTTNDESNRPTPLYNTALLTYFTPISHLLSTHTLKHDSPAFADALTLLRIWANQRGYGTGSRMCVRGFEGKGTWWSTILSAVIGGEEPMVTRNTKGTKRRPLGRGLSSYQLFRAALDFLAKRDFVQDPVFLKTKDGHKFSPEEYQDNHQAVFVDSSSTVNLLADVPLGSLDLLRYDAQKTLETLDHAPVSGDPFQEVFLKEQRDLTTRFDAILRVDLSSAKPRHQSLHATLDRGSPFNVLIASLDSLIRQGLGKRARAISILHPSSSSRSISHAHPSNPDIIYIGLIHDPQYAFGLVDHGPAADEPDQSITERFRDFWGDKAELRRFKDGRIVESVVWEVKTADERTHVPAMIVRHVLGRHFGIAENAVHTYLAAFDAVLRLPEPISRMYQGSTMSTGFKGAIRAFDDLVKAVKALGDELPLAILNISPVTEHLRYTSVFTPVPLPTTLALSMPENGSYLSPMEIILEFEKSSRWPDDLRAIQKIKLAFMERIATVLMTSIQGLKATIAIGDGVSSSEIQDKARLELVTAEGWAFSARIWHNRETTLLDRILDTKKRNLPPGTMNRPENQDGKLYQEALEAQEVYIRRFIHAPRHHRAISALCHRFVAYAGTVRLVKRWLASHWLLHGHISEEVVEIICASFFVGDGHDPSSENEGESIQVPGSKERGFANVVEFFKDWKWEDGLFVPLYGAESIPDTQKSKASSGSKIGVWTVSTEADKEGRVWTSKSPDVLLAHRVCDLAKATWDYLQNMERGNLDVQSMFIHPTEDYDFIIHLNPEKLPRYHHNIAVNHDLLSRRGNYANLEQERSIVRPGFDPAQLLFNDLKRIYSDTFKIFYDPYGGDCFGGVWDPTLSQPRPFRVLGGFSSIPTKKGNEKAKAKDLVHLNKRSVLSEIERLGLGLIREITIHV